MKRTLIFTIAMMGTLMAHAALQTPTKSLTLSNSIPDRFVPSSETDTLEWGCPVAEVVEADSRAEALHKIKTECMEQVSKAARVHDGVIDVIRTTVIWPDVQVSEVADGFELKGTFFLSTDVLKSRQARIGE